MTGDTPTRALITGGTGFAGQFLARHLLADGVAAHVTTVGTAHDGTVGTVHRCDVRDAAATLALIRDVQPDEIYHLAGVTRPAANALDAFYDVNVGGARSVLDAAATAGASARVLLVGSAYIYAPSDAPIPETWPIEPRSHYGASKAASEMIGRAYAAEGLHVVLARPFNHSGPGQPPDFVLASIVAQVATALQRGDSEVTLELGNLEPVRDISDVRDIVASYVRLLRNGESGGAYNVGSGQGHSIKELIDLVAAATGVEVAVTSTARRMRVEVFPRLVADIGRARQLGARPGIPLEDTIRDMTAAATSRGHAGRPA